MLFRISGHSVKRTEDGTHSMILHVVLSFLMSPGSNLWNTEPTSKG
uniref:Uncharacterized protein n=1 Tax=Arundo donax TaxID=35708 RepID=A0A0A8YH69_ARUDO